MTGDEYLQRGAKLRRAQQELETDIAVAKQMDFGPNDPYMRVVALRLEAVTAELDALTREFLEG